MSDSTKALLVALLLVFWLNSMCAFLILIGHRWLTLGAVASILYTTVGLVAAAIGMGFGPSLPILLFLMLVVGWFVYAWRRYAQVRQDEMFQVITAAAEARLPLAPAVWAYVQDRPREGKKFWDALLAFAFPPGYLLWVQRQVFDDRAARLAGLLAAGAPLPDALRIVRGVAPREVRVAAEVGDTTGRLAACLRRVDRDRLAGVWLEVMPRVLYPFLLLAFVLLNTVFLGFAVIPKFQKIFADFGEPLPPVTAWLFDVSHGVVEGVDRFSPLVILALPLALIAGVCVLVIPAVRWHVPLLNRLYRWEAQGMILRMLAELLAARRPAPEALGLLADASGTPDAIRPVLGRARSAIARGEPLPHALYEAGLLPGSMTPLVESSERLHTLPLALGELGDVLSGKAVRIARRVSLVVGPLLVVGVGAVVGFIAIAMFVPLLQLLSRLAE